MGEFINSILSNDYAHMVLRIALASLFGALIGLEREHARRPAGLRTHVLVCVGSCLVMLTSEFIYSKYKYIFLSFYLSPKGEHFYACNMYIIHTHIYITK